MDSPLTSPLHVQAWPDPVIDHLGYGPTSSYFEWLWLPRVGPSAAWAYRRLSTGLGRPARRLQRQPRRAGPLARPRRRYLSKTARTLRSGSLLSVPTSRRPCLKPRLIKL